MSNDNFDPAHWRERETRALTDRTGHVRVVTMSRTFWRAFEELAEHTIFDADRVIAIADHSAGSYGITFGESFAECVAYIDRYVEDKPECYLNVGKVKGVIGQVSTRQIDELERRKAAVPKLPDNFENNE